MVSAFSILLETKMSLLQQMLHCHELLRLSLPGLIAKAMDIHANASSKKKQIFENPSLQCYHEAAELLFNEGQWLYSLRLQVDALDFEIASLQASKSSEDGNASTQIEAEYQTSIKIFLKQLQVHNRSLLEIFDVMLRNQVFNEWFKTGLFYEAVLEYQQGFDRAVANRTPFTSKS